VQDLVLGFNSLKSIISSEGPIQEEMPSARILDDEKQKIKIKN
jgi:hypothetical protein